MSIPSFQETLEKLKIENINKEAWAELWDQSQERFSWDAFFLQKDFIIEQNQYLNLIDEVLEMILTALERVRKDEYLARFAYHMYYVIFEKQHKPGETLAVWPDVKNVLGDLTGGFDAIVYISGINLIKEKFKERRIDDEILKHTLFDLMEKFYRYHDAYGVWYVDCQNWMCRIFKGVFVNIGRLQYETRPNTAFKVYRNEKEDKTVAFFVSSHTVRKDGLVDGTSGITDKDAFQTVFTEDSDTVTGHPIKPTGTISDKIITLQKSEWINVLDIGDKMLNIHIPRRGRMPFEECADSFKRAIPFYKEHFPEEDLKAFHCGSWLLGNGLELLLDQDSNIIRFQREFYLAPAKSDAGATKFFVFGKYDITGITPKTSLEKKIVEFEQKGISMYNGWGFFLFRDIHRYGEQYYRNHFMEL